MTHALTVSVEEYFHGGAVSRVVLRKHWDRFESRLRRNIEFLLDRFAAHDASATFFVLGWVAERLPDLVQRIVDAGNEVASRGYWPGRVEQMLPEQFREELQRTEQALLQAGAPEVRGFRAARWLRPNGLWVLDELAAHGYDYDSSINPVLWRYRRRPDLHRVGRIETEAGRELWELPISTVSLLGCRLAISGGNYLRQFPRAIVRRAVRRWDRRRDDPMVFYLSPWEIDTEQPKIAGLSRVARLKQYRNLDRQREVLDEYLATLDFCAIRDHLGLVATAPAEKARRSETITLVRGPASATAPTSADATPVSIVIPMYNECETLPYLRGSLDELRARLTPDYAVQLVLVDDCSKDGTGDLLETYFGSDPSARIIRHDVNKGVAAAIATGIAAADTEIVCSMDSDCSYEPLELAEMIPLIDGADLVTASPYHPDGAVMNVPPWRLVLSRGLSRLYSLVLRERFYTYTSCFRVYRRSVMENLQLRNGGFLGVAEMLIRLKLAGRRIVEYPAVLESRLLGASKMATARTVCAHLGNLTGLVFRRGQWLAEPLDRVRSRPSRPTTATRA